MKVVIFDEPSGGLTSPFHHISRGKRAGRFPQSFVKCQGRGRVTTERVSARLPPMYFFFWDHKCGPFFWFFELSCVVPKNNEENRK
jgi:hypothetical protein